jgi:hypothetical protein
MVDGLPFPAAAGPKELHSPFLKDWPILKDWPLLEYWPYREYRRKTEN